MTKSKTQQHPKVEIAIKNFGPIAEANIDLRPLTVCVGPSNTGKPILLHWCMLLHGVFEVYIIRVFFLPSSMSFIRAMDILSNL